MTRGNQSGEQQPRHDHDGYQQLDGGAIELLLAPPVMRESGERVRQGFLSAIQYLLHGKGSSTRFRTHSESITINFKMM
ncbi:hypothetical protein [Cupriavidus pauculus]|uniref:Uncharacterized protein n=1 Tax=Cupriavidus pauculus TaxID=82633 RepID=A0A2N5C341_9BURK|nr:hypothetical protein [Cupriavidus pauculus]PLP96649.1 hypothetical protein CYJ10_31035 [Cupriavidus pauculus]